MTGQWSANTYHDDRAVQYVRASAALRPLPWIVQRRDSEGDPQEWYAYAFCGLLCYGIRRMRDGRFAWTTGTLHHDAVDSFAEAARLCDDDRRARVISELAGQQIVE